MPPCMTLVSLRNEKLCNIFNNLIQRPKFLFNKQAEVSVIIDHPAPLQPLRAWGRHSAGEKNTWKTKFGKVRVSLYWWGNIWQCYLHLAGPVPKTGSTRNEVPVLGDDWGAARCSGRFCSPQPNIPQHPFSAAPWHSIPSLPSRAIPPKCLCTSSLWAQTLHLGSRCFSSNLKLLCRCEIRW